MSIGNEFEKTTRVFYLFINQSDAGQLGRGDTDVRPPRHIFGRYFINSHRYTGLLWDVPKDDRPHQRSEEHTSELQSLMRISYAVFCLKKKKPNHNKKHLR